MVMTMTAEEVTNLQESMAKMIIQISTNLPMKMRSEYEQMLDMKKVMSDLCSMELITQEEFNSLIMKIKKAM